MFKLRNLIIAFLLIVCQISFAQPIVQPCYLLPTDQVNVRKIYTTDLDDLRERLSEVRSFFASEMKRLGYGEKTFEFESNIKIYGGGYTLAEYETIRDVRTDLMYWGIRPPTPDDILLVFLVGAKSIQHGAASGVFSELCQEGTDVCKEKLVVVPLEGSSEYLNLVIAHELGHAFGFLDHRKEEYALMSQGPLRVWDGRDMLQDVSIHPGTAAVINKSPVLTLIGDPPTNNEKRVQTDTLDADVNGDGYVDLSDVRIVRSAIQNSTSYDTDVNNDGKTDEIDVLLVKAKAHAAIAAAAPALIRRKKITTWGALKKER